MGQAVDLGEKRGGNPDLNPFGIHWGSHLI